MPISTKIEMREVVDGFTFGNIQLVHTVPVIDLMDDCKIKRKVTKDEVKWLLTKWLKTKAGVNVGTSLVYNYP